MINNANIRDIHIGRRGLHLNEKGSGRLAVNYLSYMRRHLQLDTQCRKLTLPRSTVISKNKNKAKATKICKIDNFSPPRLNFCLDNNDTCINPLAHTFLPVSNTISKSSKINGPNLRTQCKAHASHK